MATTIVTKSGSGAPTASDLVAGELAVDLTNKRLYTEDSGGTVLELGTNPSGNVTFGDDGKAIFGAGSDLQIYHDGGTSRIVDAGIGILAIQASSQLGIYNADGTQVSAEFVNDGKVGLRFSGSEKLATTATGIDVTGSVTAESLGIGTSSPDAKLAIEATSQGNFTEAMRITNAGGGVDEGNYIQFEISNTSGYGPRIGGRREGSGGSGLHFYTGEGNAAPIERLRIDHDGNVGIGTSSVTNPNSYGRVLNVAGYAPAIVLSEDTGRDYTIGVNGNKFLIFDETDAVLTIDDSGNAGIGTGSPNGNGILTLNTPTDTSPQIVFSENNTGKWLIGHRHDGDHFRFYDLANSAERMRLDASGHAIIPAGVTLGTATGVYAAANTLDDYEEGTWTPVIRGNTPAPTGQSYVTQNGRYTKVGRLVTLEFDVTLSAKGTVGGTYLIISGVPFSADIENKSGTTAVYFENMGVSCTSVVATANRTDQIFIWVTTAAQTSITRTNLATTYITDDTRLAGSVTFSTI